LERENRFGQAKENGDLVECPICLNDECLSEEMLSCSLNQHSFCRDCVRRYSDEQIGGGIVALVCIRRGYVMLLGSHRVTCMVEGCEADFSLEMLQSALRPETFSLLLRRRQTAELRQADIENLEQCPSCDFAMVIENTAERVFRCRNRDCLKETCR
jgi:TRIAD3 protein (E3 ubiquitin-protein ligase RNF216)